MADRKRKQEGTVSHFFAKKAKTGQDTGTSNDGSDCSTARKADNTEEFEEGSPDFDVAACVAEFLALLDFSLVDTNEEIARRLDLISESLLHSFSLVVKPEKASKEIEFQIMEAEFYLHIDGLHEDPFSHGSEDKKFSGRW